MIYVNNIIYQFYCSVLYLNTYHAEYFITDTQVQLNRLNRKNLKIKIMIKLDIRLQHH